MSTAIHEDPIAAWNAEVKVKMSAGMGERAAITELVNEQPDLHRQYIDAVNSRDPRIAARQDAVDGFNAAVDAKVEAGMDRVTAFAAVRREQPTLHGAYVNVVSADHKTASPPPPTRPSSRVSAAGEDDARVEAWNAAVKKKTDKGVSARNAVAQVADEQPDLHRAYIAAVNGQ